MELDTERLLIACRFNCGWFTRALNRYGDIDWASGDARGDEYPSKLVIARNLMCVLRRVCTVPCGYNVSLRA